MKCWAKVIEVIKLRVPTSYNDATGYFCGSDGDIIPALIRKFIHDKDTLNLWITSNRIQIDSLVIKSGYYLITEHPLPFINYKKLN